MEPQNYPNQIAQAPENINKNSRPIFFIFLLISTASLFFFAIAGHDRGGWEGLIYLLSLPVFCIIGLAALITFFIAVFHKKKDIFTWLLLVLGLVFITWFPAVYISNGIDRIIYSQDFRDDKEQAETRLYRDMEQMNADLQESRTVVDIEDNYLLLKGQRSETCPERDLTDAYAVVYTPEVKNITELLNREITARVNEKEFMSSKRVYMDASDQGIRMIERTPVLFERINQVKSQGFEDISKSTKYVITLDCRFMRDVPVDLYLNGKLVQ